MSKTRLKRLILRMLVLSAAFALVWWLGSTWLANGQAEDAGTTMPASEAPVAEVIVRSIPETAMFIGYLSAVEQVEIRSRINGRIDRVVFVEGGLVDAGALLFSIDPLPYQAVVARARAERDRAREQLSLAEVQFDRSRQLVDRGFVSRSRFDELETSRSELRATLRASEAAVRAAELDLSYTQVRAPISGRIGRALATEGNLVSGGADSAQLTNIISIDPIHVLFDVDEQTYLRALNATRGSDAAGHLTVSIQLTGETGFPHAGRLDFLDNNASPETGTLRARAILANPSGRLTPGLFARIRLELTSPRETVLVDETVIGTDGGQRFVLVMNADNVVERRAVRLGMRVAELRAIEDGLSPGDLVIVGGLHRIGPGQTVIPVRVDQEPAGPEAAP